MAETKIDTPKAPDAKPAAPTPPAARSTEPAVTTTVVAEDLMTEQEKDTSSETPGVGPASASVPSPGPVETMEDLGIGPRQPYPTGSPPVDAPGTRTDPKSKAPPEGHATRERTR